MALKSSELSRKKRMLESGENADVQFLVGKGNKKELLSAHKAILVSASDVFEAMFRVPKANVRMTDSVCSLCKMAGNPVEINDVQPVAFKAMMDFIYTEELHGVNGLNVMAVLHAGLIRACAFFPIAKLYNVFIAITEARFLKQKHFVVRCLDYVDKNIQELMQSEDFLDIDQDMLCEILCRDQLMVKQEIAIWHAAIRWVDEKCRNDGIERSATNRRKILGPAIHKIRFPIMTKEEFSESVASKVLTNDEIKGVYQYLDEAPSQQPLPFSTKKRSQPCKGTLTMKIEEFSKFVNCDDGAPLESDILYLKGLTWSISAYLGGFYLKCYGGQDPNWSCECSATLRIVAIKEGNMDYIKSINKTFDAKNHLHEFLYSVTAEGVADQSNGWYNALEDSLTLAVDFTPEEPIEIK